MPLKIVVSFESVYEMYIELKLLLPFLLIAENKTPFLAQKPFYIMVIVASPEMP